MKKIHHPNTYLRYCFLKLLNSFTGTPIHRPNMVIVLEFQDLSNSHTKRG